MSYLSLISSCLQSTLLYPSVSTLESIYSYSLKCPVRLTSGL